MTADNAADAPGWRTLWLRPRETIARILSQNPRSLVIVLAALGGIFAVLVRATESDVRWLAEWRALAFVLLGGLLFGVVTLYLASPLLAWTGRLIDGHATAATVRAAFAWSAPPSILASALLLGLVPLSVYAPDLHNLDVALRVAALALAAWSYVLFVAMLARVNGFEIVRALLSIVIAIPAVLVVLVAIRAFAFQPFSIPAGSSIPTLLVGDYVLVSKYSYGYGRYSFPVPVPTISGRILGSGPQRGDLVVFRLPRDTSTDYVKRVIGLPGDRIQMINGHLHINGQPVARQRIADFVGRDDGPAVRPIRRWRETLPNGVSHEILDREDNGYYDRTQEFRVPAGHYFMMGDNRDNSTDSRSLSHVGYVPLENIVGRVQIIYFAWDKSLSTGPRFDRIGTLVR